MRPSPLQEPRFVLDTHLGKLAGFLRMMGLDATYSPQCDDVELAAISASERRVLLTRDRGLLKRSIVTHGCLIRATEPRAQLVQVMRHYDVADAVDPLTRCLECGVRLESVDKASVLDRLEPLTREHYDAFWLCPSCHRVYWEGSHHARMVWFVEGVLAEVRGND